MLTALHHIAAAAGVPLDPSGWTCALCGPTPFARAGSTRDLLGVGWSDWDLMADRTGRSLCAGCVTLISGKPGRIPPPLRTRNVAVIDGTLHLPDWSAMWPLLTEPPAGLTVLSWATSKQKQHHLRAGLSAPDRLVVGADDGAIVLRPARHAALLTALLCLRAGDADKPRCTRTEILSGQYAPATIMRLGARQWRDAESVIAPHRGTALLELLVAHCPVTSATPTQESDLMALDPTDDDALLILHALQVGAQLRHDDPKAFWGGQFVRRVERHAHRALPDFLARAMRDLGVDAMGDPASTLASVARDWDAARHEAVMRRLADRAALLVALTYDARKARKES